ncbi:MAG: hypothetical protein EXQ52_07620 [Bryobacterales bacterium]|nr:hypothetical protein [Bryobacterales bacterium]
MPRSLNATCGAFRDSSRGNRDAIIESVRVNFVTFHKSGSQWVRDVLTDQELLGPSGLTRASTGINHFLQPWPKLPDNSFAGPVYGLSPDEWEFYSAPADKAVIVLHDPRDIVVSWADSITFSHVDSAIVDLLREGLATLSRRNRLQFGIAQFRFNSNSYRGWATRAPRENECRTSYEKLVSSGAAEFIRIVRFLGWPVPDGQIAATVERHSFLARSGRRPGETDIHSHYRRGISGDWRNHFDRRLGELFERALPGLVAAGAYEASNEWYRNLPERIPSLTDTEPESLPAAR